MFRTTCQEARATRKGILAAAQNRSFLARPSSREKPPNTTS